MKALRVLLLTTVVLLIGASSAAAASYDITISEGAASAGRTANDDDSLGRSSQTPSSVRAPVSGAGGDIASRIPERAPASGTCTVTGVVLDYAGSPVGGTDIELSYRDASGSYTGYTLAKTASDGTFSFANVPLTDSGRLWTWRSGMEYRRHNLHFVAGVNRFVLRPGQVLVQTTRSADPAWAGWDALWVECYGSNGTADREVVGTSGYAYAMEPSFDYALIYFWDNEAAEGQFDPDLPVTAGGISSKFLNINEDLASRIWVDAPYWASGPPNAKITVALDRWTTGYKARFWGDMDAPGGREIEYTGEWTSEGTTGYVNLTVPSWATPGYSFRPYAWRSDELWDFTNLQIHDFYQVCTLSPSKSSVQSGARVTFSGVIPTEDHWGSTPGKSKSVTLYSHLGTAKVPIKWDPASLGWKKVASIKADGLGRYKSAGIRMDKTRTFVVRYPGDDWYGGAYTGAKKVTVR
jgi:hypothetical protein